MNTHFASTSLAAALLIPASAPARGRGTPLDLTRVKQHVRSKRVSSFDQSGGNRNHWADIPAGERRTLFEAIGAGMINHIRISIAPPPTLSRNDILLRMYWDGNEAPCGGAPLSPFFGQGGTRATTSPRCRWPPVRARDADWSVTSSCRSPMVPASSGSRSEVVRSRSRHPPLGPRVAEEHGKQSQVVGAGKARYLATAVSNGTTRPIRPRSSVRWVA